jgi:hypothetical protein
LLLAGFSAVGGGFGAAGVRARPLTFLRFMERGAKASDILADSSQSWTWCWLRRLRDRTLGDLCNRCPTVWGACRESHTILRRESRPMYQSMPGKLDVRSRHQFRYQAFPLGRNRAAVATGGTGNSWCLTCMEYAKSRKRTGSMWAATRSSSAVDVYFPTRRSTLSKPDQ